MLETPSSVNGIIFIKNDKLLLGSKLPSLKMIYYNLNLKIDNHFCIHKLNHNIV